MEKHSGDIIELEQSILGEKVKQFSELLGIQGNGLDESDEYMVGLYNGLMLGLSVMTGKEPQFISVKKEEKNNE